jgi:hypothetical protein
LLAGKINTLGVQLEKGPRLARVLDLSHREMVHARGPRLAGVMTRDRSHREMVHAKLHGTPFNSECARHSLTRGWIHALCVWGVASGKPKAKPSLAHTASALNKRE